MAVGGDVRGGGGTGSEVRGVGGGGVRRRDSVA